MSCAIVANLHKRLPSFDEIALVLKTTKRVEYAMRIEISYAFLYSSAE